MSTSITLHNILIVEDDPDIQAIMKLVLENVGGLNVEACSNGRTAITILSCFNPQVILLDVMMPHMDGFTTYRLLKEMEQTATIPIIFVTTKIQPAEVERYRQMGAIGLISKPFDPLTLANRITQIWQNWLNWRQN